jgi:molybdenum cofactor synthesis domain-containing protein
MKAIYSNGKVTGRPWVSNAQSDQIVTASLLIIGDEILSGRTKDKNIGYISEYMTCIGIDLREVRVVPDVHEKIVAALNALRSEYDYVFTTGGIGPTHDDITADAVAAAFSAGIDHDPRAVAMLRERFAPADLNEARMRMARIPFGADLIANPISKAPGFWIGNVIVMAGVPSIMQAMLDEVAPRLRTGSRMLSQSIRAGLREGDIGVALADVQKRHPGVMIGSYPFFSDDGPDTHVVIRGRSQADIDVASAAVRLMLDEVRRSLG